MVVYTWEEAMYKQEWYFLKIQIVSEQDVIYMF
jgi:hypothetical protein